MSHTIIHNFEKLMSRGLSIVYYPSHLNVIKIENDTIFVTNPGTCKKYYIHDVETIRTNEHYRTVSIIFKSGEQVGVKFMKKRATTLFYKYLIMWLEHKHIDVMIQSIL